MRHVVGIFFALHGMVHVLGFVVSWRLAEVPGIPYGTTAAWGWLDLGPAGTRALGVAWLLGALAFVTAAVGVLASAPWAVPMTAAAAVLSAILCLAGAPAAWAGLVIDLLILLALLGLPGWLLVR